MRKINELATLLIDITQDMQLSYQERKDKLKELYLSCEEMESMLMSICEMWTSIKEEN